MARKSIKELNDFLVEYKGYIAGSLEMLEEEDTPKAKDMRNQLLGKRDLLENILRYTINGNKSYLKIKK